MERLIIQHPVLILTTWTLLNLLHYYLNFLNSRLYKNLADFDSKFEVKYDKKFFLKLLGWLVFGILWLSAYRQAILQKAVTTTNEYFALVGGLFFFVIGHLLRDILSLGKYFVYRRKIKITYFSFKASTILSSFEFFGYSTLIFLGFLISNNPLLLGGTIGLAIGGLLYIFEGEKKKYYSKVEHNPKKE